MTWKLLRVAPESISYDEDTLEHFLQDTSGYHEYQSIIGQRQTLSHDMASSRGLQAMPVSQRKVAFVP
jgi:hypothetical protein